MAQTSYIVVQILSRKVVSYIKECSFTHNFQENVRRKFLQWQSSNWLNLTSFLRIVTGLIATICLFQTNMYTFIMQLSSSRNSLVEDTVIAHSSTLLREYNANWWHIITLSGGTPGSLKFLQQIWYNPAQKTTEFVHSLAIVIFQFIAQRQPATC